MVLMLVGTITPHRDLTDDLSIRAVDERRAQYLDNFARALARRRGRVNGIVFAENSGADLSDFRALAAGRSDVEILSLPAPEVATGLGRGYLETLLVGQAVQASRLVSHEENPLVLKQTGRYHLRNFNAMLRSLDGNADLCLNLRTIPKHWADMWFYAVSSRGVQALVDRLDVLREDRAAGLPSERSLYGLALELREQGLQVQLRFSREPHFAGLRAMDAVSYTSWRQEAKWVVRSVGKKLLPRMWL